MVLISLFLPSFFDLERASCNLRKFPNLSHLHELNYLDLSNYQIYGEIPNWIWNVGILDLLNLSHNHLMSIEEPYNISHLKGLDLRFSKLRGKIPNLPPHIYYVDLSSNSFTSSIPSDIGKNLFIHFTSPSRTMGIQDPYLNRYEMLVT